MLALLALSFVLAAPTPVDAPDTLRLDVRRGQRLEIQSRHGDITVRAGGDDRIVARAGWRGRTTQSGSVIRLDAGDGGAAWRDDEDDAPLVLEVPAWLPVRINTLNGSVRVEALAAGLAVETVHGTIRTVGVRGDLSLQAVDGDVRVERADGRLDLQSVNGSIAVREAVGAIRAETVNDDVSLERIRSSDVTVSSVNGDLTWEGALQAGGRYRFTTHNGDCTLAVPAGSRATIAVATFNGEFASDYPVTTDGRRGRRFTADLGGGGGAQVELESFQGTMRIQKPRTAQ